MGFPEVSVHCNPEVIKVCLVGVTGVIGVTGMVDAL
jgi:hypothetical protein